MAVTVTGIVKTLALSGAACGIAVIAPIAAPTVAGVTVAVALSSLFIETVADDFAKKKREADKDGGEKE